MYQQSSSPRSELRDSFQHYIDEMIPVPAVPGLVRPISAQPLVPAWLPAGHWSLARQRGCEDAETEPAAWD